MDESQARAVVEIIASASTNFVTKDDASSPDSSIEAFVCRFKSNLHRALWIQGAGIVAIVGTFIALGTALG